MTIRTALRKLYTAMCGGTTNESTAGDLINAIATDYTGGGGGSDLPPVTVSNVGEALIVDDSGEWGNERMDFAPELTYNNGAVTTEVDVSDIIDAVNAHKNVYALLHKDGKTYRLPLRGVNTDAEQHPVVEFEGVIDGVDVVIAGNDATDAWTYTETAQNDYIVETTINSTTGVIADVNITLAELTSHVNQDQNVRLVMKDTDAGVTITGNAIEVINNYAVLFLVGIQDANAEKHIAFVYALSSVNGVMFRSESVGTLPSVTASNNGQVLCVVNGAFVLINADAVNDYDVTLTDAGGGTYTATHGNNAVTVDAVIAAAAAHKNVYFLTAAGDGVIKMYLSSYDATHKQLTYATSTCSVDVGTGTISEKRYFGVGFNDGSADTWGFDTNP